MQRVSHFISRYAVDYIIDIPTYIIRNDSFGFLLLFFNQANEKEVDLSIKFQTGMNATYLFADKSKISQVIRNLLSNGLKFTKSNGHVEVAVRVVQKPQNITHVVKDLRIPRTRWRFPRKAAAVEDSFSDGASPDSSVLTRPYLLIEVTDSGAGISEVGVAA